MSACYERRYWFSDKVLERFKGTKLTCNAEMRPAEVRENYEFDISGEKLLKAAVQQLHLSGRAYHYALTHLP